MKPFRIQVTDQALDELRARLAGVRRQAPPGSTAAVEELVEYWRDHYDWRAWEAKLNQYPQFSTTIDGATVHFLHIKSPEPAALPLVLTHGWPGSVAEFLDLIGPLSDPRRHGLDPSIAFDLVIPSLPGFAWSGPTSGGWGPRRIARAWAVLMRRLGYRRYGAAGNDWGSIISPELGRIAPDEVVGVHVTQLFSLPDGESMAFLPTSEPADLDQLSPPDRQALQALRSLQREGAAYSHIHTQRPTTLGYALSDSPIGLLAWNRQVMSDLDPDRLLTHVSTYWLTGTAGSSLQIYAEAEREDPIDSPTTVPLGLAQFADDIQAIRHYAARDHANIVSWNVYDRGGHFAAHQEPDLLIEDLRSFFTAQAGAPGPR
ncbi:epoxide hydrolase family protein [Kribbella lupini]